MCHALAPRRRGPGLARARGPAAAWEALQRSGDRTGTSDGERFWMISHAELLLADAEHAQVHTSPWRSLRARAAEGEGDRGTASRLAAEELALARLDGTSARLERAKAHVALGNVATALDLAERCGADGLAARLRLRLAA